MQISCVRRPRTGPLPDRGGRGPLSPVRGMRPCRWGRAPYPLLSPRRRRSRQTEYVASPRISAASTPTSGSDLPPQNWTRSCERIRAGRGEPAWPASGDTAEEIIGHLRGAEVALAQGQPVGAVVRTLGISEPTDDRGRREDGGLRVDQAQRRKGLERENSRRKRLVADQALDNAMVRDVAAGNVCARPSGAGRRPPAPTSPPCRRDGPTKSPARRGHRRAPGASRRRMSRR